VVVRWRWLVLLGGDTASVGIGCSGAGDIQEGDSILLRIGGSGESVVIGSIVVVGGGADSFDKMRSISAICCLTCWSSASRSNVARGGVSAER